MLPAPREERSGSGSGADLPPPGAIRKGSPQFASVVADLLREAHKITPVQVRRDLAAARVKRLHNNEASADYRRFESTIDLFRKYGARDGFDPVMLAAQGYQESRLRQEARSPAGAVGVMQLLPSTGSDLRVGDITKLEPNIHAGTKYMSQLMTRYFP